MNPRFEIGDTISYAEDEEGSVLIAQPDSDGWIVVVDSEGEYRLWSNHSAHLVRSLSAKNVGPAPASGSASTPAGPPPAGVALSTVAAPSNTVEPERARSALSEPGVVEAEPSHGTTPTPGKNEGES